jgi:hypothetical protein
MWLNYIYYIWSETQETVYRLIDCVILFVMT